MTDITPEHGSGTYNGSDFHVDQFWMFCVPDLDKRFDSYQKMKDAIDGAAARIAATKKAKLNLPVLSPSGVETVIVGVHSGHGGALTKPKVDLGHGDAAYPNLPWIRQAIERSRELELESRHITEALRAVRFGAKGYGYAKSDEYDGTPEGLEKLYHAKLAKANATSLEELLKKTPKPRKDWL